MTFSRFKNYLASELDVTLTAMMTLKSTLDKLRTKIDVLFGFGLAYLGESGPEIFFVIGPETLVVSR